MAVCNQGEDEHVGGIRSRELGWKEEEREAEVGITQTGT